MQANRLTHRTIACRQAPTKKQTPLPCGSLPAGDTTSITAPSPANKLHKKQIPPPPVGACLQAIQPQSPHHPLQASSYKKSNPTPPLWELACKRYNLNHHTIPYQQAPTKTFHKLGLINKNTTPYRTYSQPRHSSKKTKKFPKLTTSNQKKT